MAKETIDSLDKRRLESHSMMLGQIANEVEEFCTDSLLPMKE